MELTEEEYLEHYGTPRHSGRYPWGSGDNQENTRNQSIVDYIKEEKEKGLSEKEIAKGRGMTIKQMRDMASIERAAIKKDQIRTAQKLQEKGYGSTAGAQHMGIPESTYRTLLAPGAEDKVNVISSTADSLRREVDQYGMLDVGSGIENFKGVTRTRLDAAITQLRSEGYELVPYKIYQQGTGKETNAKALAVPGTTFAHVNQNKDKIHFPSEFSEDGGRNYGHSQHPPIEINPKRVDVLYGPDGGAKADGMIYVRPGVKDIELGGANYAQVRVAVGKDHFLKGMAMYREDLPEGVDILFNTNKESTGNKLDAMKKNADETPDPSGKHVLLKSIRRQIVANPGTPDERVTSAMNIVNEEGKWADWNKELSSQMLSKQSRTLAKAQLDMTYEQREKEYQEILALTNPTVRRKLLQGFADGTDSAAVHLQAAALPRTGNHVILPLATIDPLEIYAPSRYFTGERVVLIRHPHGGRFEIPELIVNNNNAEGKRLLGNSRDAVGIHHSVAQRLSGADFDGDTVLVIPNNQSRVKSDPALEGLKDFDPRRDYPGYDGMKVMSNTQTEMGIISNLITDMTLKGARIDHMTRAIKHSMVVIDAEKHKLNYRLSATDNNIKDLKKKYQSGGASTLISRAGARAYLPDRELRKASRGGPINKETGELIYEPTGKINYKTQELQKRRHERLAITSDAHELVSFPGTPMERLYADHSNKLKALANKARVSYVNTPSQKQSPSAKKTYANEVESLDAKLSLVVRNRPLERQAQIISGSNIKARRNANPNMDEDTLKKIKYQALQEARARTGAKKYDIVITDDEWDAIQAGAVSESKLSQILDKADMDVVREHATPREQILMTDSMQTRAAHMFASGASRAEVAKQLGVSLSTLDASVQKGEL